MIALAAVGSHESRATDEATRIEIDQQANIIRFLIDGEESMRLDADGLKVRGDIGYGGAVADFGADGFDRGADAVEGRNDR